MASIIIRIHKEIFNVNSSEIDLDNCRVVKKGADDLFDEFSYQFRSGNFIYEWTQDEPGGKIIIEEEAYGEPFEDGKDIRLIKEIDLKNI